MVRRARDEAVPHEVVWISHKHDQTCAKCGKELGRGNFVQVNERDGVRCKACAGYADLCFLPAGGARLTPSGDLTLLARGGGRQMVERPKAT